MEMPFALSLVTAATTDPVSLDEAKSHLRVDSDDTTQDQEIKRQISAATRRIQQEARRQLVTATYRLSLDSFYGRLQWWGADLFRVPNPREYQGGSPFGSQIYPYNVITLPLPPLQSITTVAYTDTSGNSQTLTQTTDFLVDTDSEPGRITPAYGKVWPTPRAIPNAVAVTFVCGYGAASAVPASFREAILKLTEEYYRGRGDSSMDELHSLPRGIRDLIGAESYGSYT